MLTTNNPVSPFEEVVPAAAAVRGLTRSSILTQRRRVRAAAQTGRNYGTAGANGANSQIQFIVADAGGLLDPESICFVYNIQTAGTTAAPDDGHPFTRIQVNLNGQPLEDVQQAARATNAEVKLSCGHNWYKGAGSFCGFELLNNELAIGDPVAGVAAGALTGNQVNQYVPAWADVANNLPAVANRCNGGGGAGGAAQAWNPLGGEQRIMPLGLISGVGRMKQYLPLNVLGELNITLYTGSAAETVVQAQGATNGDFSLAGVFIEYDIVVPHPAYAELLQKLANDPSEAGLLMPYESTITATGGAIAASGSLADTSLIVSRATQNLLRTYVVQQPTTILNSANFPSQSCFGHAGTASIQFRVGSQYFPAIPAEGDASMWAMTTLAYGTASTNDNGGTINREMWRVFSSQIAANPVQNNEGFRHFALSDSFIPAYGFQVVKGKAEALDVDGISLSGASGSQLVVQLRSAPAVGCTPMVGLVALRFISAQGGAVRVMGA